MKIELTRQKVHNEFTKKVELISGQNLFACYQCGNCTAGCPVAFAMEIGPHEVIRYTLLGLEEEAVEGQYLLALCLLPPMHVALSQRDRYCPGDGCLEDGRPEKEGQEGPYSDPGISGRVSGKSSPDRLCQRLRKFLSR